MRLSMPRHVTLLLYSILAVLLVSFGNAAEQEQLREVASATPKRVAIIGMPLSKEHRFIRG